MLSIIVLEDDAASAALVTRIFTMNGHHARGVATIAEAWRLLCEDSADLLVLDTDLGGEWGWEMLERVRRSAVFRELPVIVYSALWRRDIVRRYMLLGVQGLLVKPYTPARLIEEAARAAESCWREPFFDFAEAPAEGGPDGERRAALIALAEAQPETMDLAGRLLNNCTHIAWQAQMTRLGERARNAGYSLLGEIADRITQAAIEIKLERLSAAIEDLEVAHRILRRLLGLGALASPSAAVPAIEVLAAPAS